MELGGVEGNAEAFLVKIEGPNGRLSLLVLLARGNQKTETKKSFAFASSAGPS